ncbi:MAG: GIN domain-containing protein [Bacteroidales bacterium]
MKTTQLLLLSAMLLFSATFPAAGAPGADKADISKEQRQVDPFTGVSAGSVFEVFLTQGSNYHLEVEAPAEHLQQIRTVVEDDVLIIEFTGRERDLRDLKVHVTAPRFEYLHAGEASSMRGQGTLTTPAMDLKVSGAASMDLEVVTEQLTTDLSGATGITLSGEATEHYLNASGVSRVRAYGLATNYTDVNSSGTATVRINAKNKLTASASGTSTVTVRGNPSDADYSTSGTASVRGVNNNATSAEEKESTVIRLGGTEVVMSDGQSPSIRRWRGSWQNNWSGFFLGLNGYSNSGIRTSLSNEYSFMELDYNKSIQLNLNMFHQNVVLARGTRSMFGLVSGLGLQWNNYHLSNNIILTHQENGLDYQQSEHSLSTNRLRILQLNVPLMMEFQVREGYGPNRFHIAAGIQGGYRLRSHTKVEYRDSSGDKQSDRVKEDFHLVPIRLDAIGQIGWGRLNFFATYSLNTMFKDDRGPDIHPFSIGIRLLSL